MSDINDLGRIGYVLKNYNTAELVLDKNGRMKTSREIRNSDNSHAPVIRFKKKVNGTYYVVEVVPDSSAKQLRIMSAYMEKGSTDQVLNMPQSGSQLTPEVRHGANTPYSNVSRPAQNVNGSQNQQVQDNPAFSLPSVLELSSETLREWLQAAGITGESLSALQALHIQNSMAPEKASQAVLQNLLNRYASVFQNGIEGVTAQAIAEAAEKDRLERTVAGENARYNGTAEALVKAALQLPRDTEARNLADQATITRQAEILGKLEELEAAQKRAGEIRTSEQMTEFTRTVGRLEQELEALEQGRLSDRLSSEELGRLAEAVQTGQRNQIADTIAPQTAGPEQQKLQLATAWENGNLTEGGIDGKVDTGKSQAANILDFKNVLENGRADEERLRKFPKVFAGKTVQDIDTYLNSLGYETTRRSSVKQGSNAQVIVMSNYGSNMNISQLQVSPGGGKHGPNPYIKISTTDIGKIKIVFGNPATYIARGEKNIIVIFAEGGSYD